MVKITDKNALELFNALLEGNHIDEVTDCAARFLHNPVAVFDTSYHIVAYAKTFKVNDIVWQEAIKRGYWSYEFVAKIHRLMEQEDNRDSGAVIIEGISPLRRRIARLILDGEHLGYFATLEANSSLDRVPEDSYQLACRILAKELSSCRLSVPHAQGKTCESILGDLVGGHFANRMLFQERIQGTEFEKFDLAQLLVLDLQHYAASDSLGEELRASIHRLLPYCWSVVDERYVVVLVDLEHRIYHTAQPFGDFAAFLVENKIRAAQSGSFRDLFLLPAHYAQASRALELSILAGDTRPLIQNDQYKVLQLIASLPRDQLEFYCTDVILCIWDYDVQNKTDYLRTLFHYLHTGRSVQHTSENLIIHRNTVTYRIDRIKEVFNVDFENAYQNMQNYLSCLALYYSRKGTFKL